MASLCFSRKLSSVAMTACDFGGTGLRRQFQGGDGVGPFATPFNQLLACRGGFLLGRWRLFLQPFQLPGCLSAFLPVCVNPRGDALGAIEQIGQRLVPSAPVR